MAASEQERVADVAEEKLSPSPQVGHHHHRHHTRGTKKLSPSELFVFAVLAGVGAVAIGYIFQGVPELPNVKHIGCFKSDASFSQVRAIRWYIEVP